MIMDPRWKALEENLEDDVGRVFNAITHTLSTDYSGKAVSVVFMNDVDIQALNQNYRRKNKPTNVLSFPSDVPDEWGDILLSYETIERESRESRISLKDHLSHLIIHGFLHLLGYDHETNKDAERMEELEIKILNHLNIKNPYEDQ